MSDTPSGYHPPLPDPDRAAKRLRRVRTITGRTNLTKFVIPKLRPQEGKKRLPR